MSVVIHWLIEGRDLLPPESALEMRAAPPAGLMLIDGGEGGMDPTTLAMTVPVDLAEGHLVWEIPLEASFPLEFGFALFLDGEEIATAEISLGLPEATLSIGPEGSAAIASVGDVTVMGAGPEGPHPWVNYENFVTDCPTGSVLPGPWGVCSASFTIYNDSNFTLAGYAGFTLDLRPNPESDPVYYSSETQICRAGAFNQVMRCTLAKLQLGIPPGTAFKSQDEISIPPWSRIDMSKTIFWTLDPAQSWAPTRSSRSFCSLADGFGDDRECQWLNAIQAQGSAGDPINTSTGGLDYSVEDLGVTTSAGMLVFQRSYSSALIRPTTLGYGWYHNHDVRLLLPGDPYAQQGVVWFKAHSANQYAFLDNGDGTYTATSGVLAMLSRDAGPPVTYTILTETQQTYSFDATGKLVTWSDPQGHSWTYSYDGNGLLDRVTDDTGLRYLDFEYNSQGQLTSVADQTGRNVSFSYSPAGDLHTVTDVLGQTWSYDYDAGHRLTAVTDPLGAVLLRTEYEDVPPPMVDFYAFTITTYAGGDGAHTMTIEDGGSTLHLVGNSWKKISFPYTVTPNTVLEFDFRSGAQGDIHAIGLDTDDYYSAERTFRLYGTENWGINHFNNYSSYAPAWHHYRIPIGRYMAGSVVYMFFSNDHDVPTPTAESYFSNIRVYDESRAVRQYNGEDELIVEITYNSDGSARLVDGLGNDTIHGYDGRNSLTNTTNDLGNASTREYNGHFRPTLITDENGNTTQLAWSADGANLTQVIDPAGNQVDLTYDSLNNLRQVTDARGYTTTYTYNETDPDPTRRTLLLSVEDALSSTTTYTYTTAADYPQPPGLLKTTTDPLGRTIQFTYNPFGQRISMTDALGHTTQYAYDALGRLQRTTDPMGHVTWTCYDAAGRVIRTVANATGDGGTPQTDPCNASQYVPSSDPDKDRITTTVYDIRGNAIATIDPSGAITRTYYDQNNRPVVVVQNLTGQSIENPTPPTYNPAYPDRNVRSETVYDDAGNPIATIDNRGIITRTYYDTLNRPQFVVVNLVGQGIGVGTPPAYDPNYPDRNVRTQYVYDPAGNTIATIDTLGRITRTYYDENNRPVTVVQNLTGQTIDNPTPPSRNPSYPAQNVRTDTVYDANGNAIASVDPKGVITRTYYDPLNRPEYVVQNLYGQDISVPTPPTYSPAYPDRNVRTQYVYDDAGNQIAVIDPNGVITRTYYDDANRAEYVVQNLYGQAISVPTPPAYDPQYPDRNVRTQYVYDHAGRQIAVIDANGVITRTYYDGLGRVRYVVRNLTGQGIEVETPPVFNPIFPDRNVRTETVYDADGDAIATIDNAGVITRTYYDGLHRPVTVVQNLAGQGIEVETPPVFNPAYPDQNVRTDTVYGATGEVVRTIDTLGHATVSCYDGQGRVIKTVQNPSVSDPCGPYTPSAETDLDIITLTAYDGLGNRVSVTDPNGLQTTYQYDAVYRLLTETDPLSHATRYGYDLSGNRDSLTDAEGVVTRFEYDALARLTAVVQNYRSGVTPDHETNVRTEYTYDAAGYRLTIRDGNGHATTFTYDALGRLKTESDALGHTWTYGYDAAGNRVSLLDAEGFTTFYTYDGLNRLIAIYYPSPDADVTYTYDAAGDRVGMSDGVGTTQWVYDDLHRPTSVTDPFSATVGYTYDGLGNRLTLTYPDARAVSYAYDDAGRLVVVTDWDSLVTTYTYDRGGRPATTTLPNGIVSTSSFDDAGRLLSLTHVQGGTTLASYTYTYDDVGNRLTAAETVYTPATVSTPDVIFADGFESGGLGAWSSSSTGSGTLSVTTSAALAGAYGMQALINSTTARYVQDTLPYAEPRYRARFYFDPNSSTMGNNDAYYLFYGYTGSSTVVLRVELGFTTAGGYRLRVSALNNASTWSYSGWVGITDAPHAIELDWQSAVSGRVDWWIDGAPQAAVTGFDNSSRRIDQVRLGTVAGLDAGTSGTVYFDAFDSRRRSFVGSDTNLPDAIFADDFESGGLGYWSASTGVSVTTAASLAPAGTWGMSVPLASATTAKYVTDKAPGSSRATGPASTSTPTPSRWPTTPTM